MSSTFDSISFTAACTMSYERSARLTRGLAEFFGEMHATWTHHTLHNKTMDLASPHMHAVEAASVLSGRKRRRLASPWSPNHAKAQFP